MPSPLLQGLKSFKKALKLQDIALLRRVSNKAVEACALGEEDAEDSFYLALISYMLAKLLSKTHYWTTQEKKNFVEKVGKEMDQCVLLVEGNKPASYRQCIVRALEDIRQLEIADARYVHDLESKTRTKLASRLYAEGFSLSRATSLTGAHKRDLMQYSGRTLIADRVKKTKPMIERIQHMRTIFSRGG